MWWCDKSILYSHFFTLEYLWMENNILCKQLYPCVCCHMHCALDVAVFWHWLGEKKSGRDHRSRSKPQTWIFTLTFGTRTARRRQTSTAGLLKWTGARRCILIRDEELSCCGPNKRLIQYVRDSRRRAGVTHVCADDLCFLCGERFTWLSGQSIWLRDASSGLH